MYQPLPNQDPSQNPGAPQQYANYNYEEVSMPPQPAATPMPQQQQVQYNPTPEYNPYTQQQQQYPPPPQYNMYPPQQVQYAPPPPMQQPFIPQQQQQLAPQPQVIIVETKTNPSLPYYRPGQMISLGPMNIHCTHCGYEGLSSVRRGMGVCTFLWFILCCIFGFVIGAICLICGCCGCINHESTVHVCPNCQAVVASGRP